VALTEDDFLACELRLLRGLKSIDFSFLNLLLRLGKTRLVKLLSAWTE